MSESIDNISPNPTNCSMENEFIFNQNKQPIFIKNRKQELPIHSQHIENIVSNQKIKKNRCHTCKKKLGLISFTCKCKFIFCSKHRYITQHNCTYDYKKNFQIEYLKKNPKIENIKIIKI